MMRMLKLKIFGKNRYFKSSAEAKKAFLYSGDPDVKSLGWVNKRRK